jgi:hypothetical protein
MNVVYVIVAILAILCLVAIAVAGFGYVMLAIGLIQNRR